MTHKYIVSVSGGLGSAEVLRRAIIKYGRENVIAVFADVKGKGFHQWSRFPSISQLLHERFGGESPDTYRFLWQLSYALDIPIERLEDGRSIWDVFYQKKAFRIVVGSAFYCPASEELKREVIAQWIEKRYREGEFTLLLGMDWDEDHRLKNARFWWAKRLGYAVNIQSLLMENITDDCHISAVLAGAGVETPKAYANGFSHNNCHQGCVNAGQAHFAQLYKTLPENYLYWAWNEQEINHAIGKGYTILKDTRNGEAKRMSLYDFIPRIESDDYRKFDFGGCGCFAGALVQSSMFTYSVQNNFLVPDLAR